MQRRCNYNSKLNMCGASCVLQLRVGRYMLFCVTGNVFGKTRLDLGLLQAATEPSSTVPPNETELPNFPFPDFSNELFVLQDRRLLKYCKADDATKIFISTEFELHIYRFVELFLECNGLKAKDLNKLFAYWRIAELMVIPELSSRSKELFNYFTAILHISELSETLLNKVGYPSGVLQRHKASRIENELNITGEVTYLSLSNHKLSSRLLNMCDCLYGVLLKLLASRIVSSEKILKRAHQVCGV